MDAQGNGVPDMSASVSPGQAAKNFARANADKSGTLMVISLTPAGRGGWKVKAKETTFYFSGGKVAQTRWPRGGLEFNGVCCVCGAVHLKPELQLCEDAGKQNTGPACPECMSAHNLHPYTDWRRGQSPLKKFDEYRVDCYLDVRSAQLGEGLAQECWAIETYRLFPNGAEFYRPTRGGWQIANYVAPENNAEAK